MIVTGNNSTYKLASFHQVSYTYIFFLKYHLHTHNYNKNDSLILHGVYASMLQA